MGLMIIVSVLFYLMMVDSVIGNVVLMGRNVSRSFEDMEATFTPQIKGSGESGLLYLADPLDACSPLMKKVVGSSKSSFALIIRGACSFDDKVRHAQNAGFKAAIIYDFEDGSPLVAMGGSPGGIKIPAVFISKAAGTILKTYAGLKDIELWILPTIENSAWSIMAVSFISLLAISAMLATCFFVRRQHGRSEMPRTPQEFYGMSRRMVKAMPSLIFTTVLEDNCSSVTCAICLEDYKAGDKLRILPCCHKFHAFCVDSWLTSWRTFCPMCKRDARTNIPIPPPSESTPLLSSVSPSPSPSSTIRSYHSSLVASPPVPIISTPPWSPSTSRNHSLSSSHHMTNSHKSSNNLPGIYIHRSSADLRNVNSSQRSQTSHFMTPRSVGVPMSSPYGSRYICAYNQSSSNASPIYLAGSSSRPSYLRHCESGASISALASAQSLPSC